MSFPELTADLTRVQVVQFQTGIFVRAKIEGKWANVDIGQLTRDSLLAWLRTDGVPDTLAEKAVLILLGHSR